MHQLVRMLLILNSFNQAIIMPAFKNAFKSDSCSLKGIVKLVECKIVRQDFFGGLVFLKQMQGQLLESSILVNLHVIGLIEFILQWCVS
jgi:hypothetical protein